MRFDEENGGGDGRNLSAGVAGLFDFVEFVVGGNPLGDEVVMCAGSDGKGFCHCPCGCCASLFSLKGFRIGKDVIEEGIAGHD